MCLFQKENFNWCALWYSHSNSSIFLYDRTSWTDRCSDRVATFRQWITDFDKSNLAPQLLDISFLSMSIRRVSPEAHGMELFVKIITFESSFRLIELAEWVSELMKDGIADNQRDVATMEVLAEQNHRTACRIRGEDALWVFVQFQSDGFGGIPVLSCCNDFHARL